MQLLPGSPRERTVALARNQLGVFLFKGSDVYGGPLLERPQEITDNEFQDLGDPAIFGMPAITRFGGWKCVQIKFGLLPCGSLDTLRRPGR